MLIEKLEVFFAFRENLLNYYVFKLVYFSLVCLKFVTATIQLLLLTAMYILHFLYTLLCVLYKPLYIH